MRIFLACLLLVANSLAAPEKNKRDAEYFGQFQLPTADINTGVRGSFAFVQPPEAEAKSVNVEHSGAHAAVGGFGYLESNSGLQKAFEFGHEEHSGAHADSFAIGQLREVDSAHHDEYGLPNVGHEEYGLPHVPHEEYGPPIYTREETTTPHYCPEEDFKSEFIPNPPEIPSYPLPDIPIAKQEYFVPHEEYGPPQIPHEEYGIPTTTLPPVTTTLPPPPPPTVRYYPYPAPVTTTLPPPPPTVRYYPYPAPTTTTTTTTTAAPRSAKYPAKVESSYGGQFGTIDAGFGVSNNDLGYGGEASASYSVTGLTGNNEGKAQADIKEYNGKGKVHLSTSVVHHHPAIHAPVIRFIEPKLVVHKKVVSFPLLKKKFFKFGK